LEGCIEGTMCWVFVSSVLQLTKAGYESLYLQAGIIQRDISTGNLMMNEDSANPSWPAFLIDLDLAIREQRQESSGARGRTGTRAFMAIGALLDEQHSFMHDLESFFWVLFWICIHYTGPNGTGRVVPEFESWNYMTTGALATMKAGTIHNERRFMMTMRDFVTPYFQPLVPYVNRLRRLVFPNGSEWLSEDKSLNSRMREVLRDAMHDPAVLAEWKG